MTAARVIAGVRFVAGLGAAVAAGFLAEPGSRAAATLVDLAANPRAAVEMVGLDEARWTAGFWHERQEHLRTRLLPDMLRLMDGTNVSRCRRDVGLVAAPRGDPVPRGNPGAGKASIRSRVSRVTCRGDVPEVAPGVKDATLPHR